MQTTQLDENSVSFVKTLSNMNHFCISCATTPTSVKKVSDLNNEISNASIEQSNGIGQIGKAMQNLDHSTQQNAAHSEELASSSDAISKQTERLQNAAYKLACIVDGVLKSKGTKKKGTTSSTDKKNPTDVPPSNSLKVNEVALILLSLLANLSLK